MQKAGNLWVPDSDWYFGPYFANGNDVFEKIVLLTGLRHVKQFRTAVDGGAHVGSWTRYLAKRFATVHAFEPQTENFDCLVANTSDLVNVYLSKTALGDEFKKARMEPGNNTGCWHLADGDDVYVNTLDSREIHNVDYLKLDVEGYEYFALKGAEETVKRSHPIIQIEEKKLPHSYECPPARELLKQWGYMQIDQYGRDIVFAHGSQA